MPGTGFFSFVLHSHLPYVRRAGVWPHGEEMIHEAIAETYIPLIRELRRLELENVPARFTIGLTPILLEQLADDDVLRSFVEYARTEVVAARRDAADPSRDAAMVALSEYYAAFYEGLLATFNDELGGDIVGAFRHAFEIGQIEVLTSGATHGYLPLLSRDSSINAQLAAGRATTRRHMGRDATGIWLPECAYRPGYVADTGLVRPGIEDFLAARGLDHFFTETHVVSGVRSGKVTGDVVGPYGAPRRRVVEWAGSAAQRDRTVLRPYGVRDAAVSVFARDPRTGLLVWSANQGYPGDFSYREFHRKDVASGLQYWRVTGSGVDLGAKALYDPAVAAARVRAHARHFVGVVAETLAEHYATHGRPGLIVSAYDTELFGHWWFEGVSWLGEVARLLASHPDVAMMTTAEYLASYPAEEAIDLPEISWGTGGDHSTWINDETAWMWPEIHRAERVMEECVALASAGSSDCDAVLRQLGRELLLLESSDWPFLISTGQAGEYAAERFRSHVERFDRLADAARTGARDAGMLAYLAEIERSDNPFPDLDWRWFAARQGSAALIP
ncbi:MAG: DUF1957 domain-containing protein [Chloroflexota bacterium]|nr:MAG: DUF1957 domain-containing protein [Chloroflexota bacterium]